MTGTRCFFPIFYSAADIIRFLHIFADHGQQTGQISLDLRLPLWRPLQLCLAFCSAAGCRGCGLCAKACPKHLIELIRADKEVAVRCSNQDKGPAVKKACSAGCIGCKLCMKQCEHDAIQVENNVAHIDYEKCVGCKKCAEKCPSKIITQL